MRTTILVASLAAMIALVPAVSAAPANDDFADAADLGGLPAGASLDTTDSTDEAGEPSPCGGIGSTVWFTLTAAADAPVQADSFGSDYDTVLAVYSGTSLGDLVNLDCNDDTGGLQSQIGWSATAGTTYFLQAGGFVGDVGALVLTVAELSLECVSGGPAHDCFENATTVAALPFVDVGSNAGAGMQALEQAPCGLIASTVWYSWTAAANMPVVATTAGSDYDTVLAVYRGTSIADLVRVACNDDLPFGISLNSALTFNAAAGTTYFFQLGGFFGDQGTFTLAAA